MSEAAITLHHRLEPEDQARADFYALLARLYAAGPDAALLAAIAAAPPLDAAAVASDDEGSGSQLAAAWDRLRAASAAMDPDAATQEYVDVFVGVGKSEVNLHGSHWLTGFMMEKPLAELRADLAALGLARRPEVTMLEDHLSALCETMRILIGGQGERRPAPVPEQRRFFEARIAPWANDCCTAIENCPLANYYRRVAEFTRFLLAIERDALAME
jgi:TorA maturation chaperone TorD